MTTAKKANALEDVALVAGTQQNLSNLYYIDIYVRNIENTGFLKWAENLKVSHVLYSKLERFAKKT
jgi:hypothetical protein